MLNDAFKALSDPTRRRILELLTERDMTAGEIADCFDISKPSISHHLSVLKSSGLVLDERRGQNIVYSLNMTVFQELVKWFFDFSKGGKIRNEVIEKGFVFYWTEHGGAGYPCLPAAEDAGCGADKLGL